MMRRRCFAVVWHHCGFGLPAGHGHVVLYCMCRGVEQVTPEIGSDFFIFQLYYEILLSGLQVLFFSIPCHFVMLDCGGGLRTSQLWLLW